MGDNNFNVDEEIFALITLHRNSRDTDIFDEVNGTMGTKTESVRLTAICTPCVTAMLGKKDGFIGQLITNGIEVPSFYVGELYPHNECCGKNS